MKNFISIVDMFQRIQLNFHAIQHKVEIEKFIPALLRFPDKQFIFQMDSVNNNLLNTARAARINAVPLFDTSGGAGILPDRWPSMDGYCGYAGGLSPGNIEQQIPLIEAATISKPVWIDAETHLRSSDNKILDEYKTTMYIIRSSKYLM